LAVYKSPTSLIIAIHRESQSEIDEISELGPLSAAKLDRRAVLSALARHKLIEIDKILNKKQGRRERNMQFNC